MGYRSTVTGEMIFSRPLKRSEAERPELAKALDDDWSIWKFAEEQIEKVDADGDLLLGVRFTGLELRYDDEVKTIGYGWHETLAKIILQLPDDVKISGMFESVGEGHGDGEYDAERLYVVGRVVHVVRPEVRWPDAPEGAI